MTYYVALYSEVNGISYIISCHIIYHIIYHIRSAWSEYHERNFRRYIMKWALITNGIFPLYVFTNRIDYTINLLNH